MTEHSRDQIRLLFLLRLLLPSIIKACRRKDRTILFYIVHYRAFHVSLAEFRLLDDGRVKRCVFQR